MGNEYLVLSDMHLADVEDHDDGWKIYKSSRFLFDDEFSDILDHFVKRNKPGSRLTLVLNGDVFDFDLVTAVPEDAPWPVNLSERRRGLHSTEEKSIWKLERMLDDHPGFVEALAVFLSKGHKLVYLMGNHDREFHYPGVQDTLRQRIIKRAEELGGSFEDDAITFEPWFYLVPGEIYVEHGQQYDHYTSFRNLLSPVVKHQDEERLALPMGNLSNRYLMSKMGFFNPHASDYILNLFSYLAHWLKYYALSPRSLMFNWLWGSLVVIGKLLRIRKKLLGRSRDKTERLEEVAERNSLSLQTVRKLSGLQRQPITTRFFRIIREFWIDRLLMAIVMTGGTITLALVAVPLWVKLMVPLTGFPMIYFIYERFAQGENIFTIEKRFPEVARSISELVPVKVVTFGHTHVPRMIPLSREVSFVDTGTWAPITSPKAPDRPVPGYRNYLLASFPDDQPHSLTFDSWMKK